MPEFAVAFDLSPFKSLDELALLSCQDYNFGNVGDWFNEFRGGLYGFYARLYGVQRHYYEVHTWLPPRNVLADTEFHLTAIFFNMDSALECLTFGLNALGWVVAPTRFRDVTDAKALKRISPLDVLGDQSKKPRIAPLAGYQDVFPRMQVAWQNAAKLIEQVRDLHDVSKHRKTVFVGGQARNDPPEGFFEAIGLSQASRGHSIFMPMAEIILMDAAKLPSIQRRRRVAVKNELLEDLVPRFSELVDATGTAVLGDAQANVPLKVKKLRR
jgi:hypothetical protein